MRPDETGSMQGDQHQQSEAMKSRNRATTLKSYQTQLNTPSQKNMNSFINQVSMPPESVASMVSLPVTSFEDTQQMLRAYKKKKRELAKIKEQFFKLETEFLQVKEKGKSYEEELAIT